jgi:hypothetical protein
MMEPNERFGSGIWNQASVDKSKASVSLDDGGLASLVQAMAGHAGDRPGLDLITLAQATNDPSQQNHIGASLHSG